jgi:hypothetical protein
MCGVFLQHTPPDERQPGKAVCSSCGENLAPVASHQVDGLTRLVRILIYSVMAGIVLLLAALLLPPAG